jgi:adenylate cyclase
MPQNPGKLEKFWNELKRRKVIQVVSVYAAIAFVILQLVDMVAEPLQLPDGTEALVIVLLCIGFFIAIFLSWVYDITPAGVSKTKPVKLTGHNGLLNNAKSGGWKIATGISAVMITVLLVFNFIPGEKGQNNPADFDKSIAVLPFANDSPDKENEYFCNGMMDEILNDLQKIDDLKVKSRISVERFRNPDQDIKEIGQQLDVSYILEGGVRKNGDLFCFSSRSLIYVLPRHTLSWMKRTRRLNIWPNLKEQYTLNGRAASKHFLHLISSGMIRNSRQS